MQEEILSNLDKAIRNSYNSWLNDKWIVYDDEKLQDDWNISINRKEWGLTNKDDEEDYYVWAYLELEGDDPIWNLFGLPSINGNEKVNFKIWISDNFEDKSNAINQFDILFEEQLLNIGFQKKGGPKNRTYTLQTIIKKQHIINGLTNEDWDDALKQMVQIWNSLDKINWSEFNKFLK